MTEYHITRNAPVSTKALPVSPDVGHIEQRGTTQPASPEIGHIHHVIIRDVEHHQPSDYSIEDLHELEDCFAELPHVQTVTIETKHIELGDAVERIAMQIAIDKSKKLRYRTWKEAYEIALEAKSAAGSSRTDIPISPLWANPRYQSMRNRW